MYSLPKCSPADRFIKEILSIDTGFCLITSPAERGGGGRGGEDKNFILDLDKVQIIPEFFNYVYFMNIGALSAFMSEFVRTLELEL